uniref:Protein phosphatase n=1 Tax=Alexandrium monilatum TaxID=311494 RepID=A0A7S4UJ61_9DINO|mmetsp:Transcript_57711/g.180857  ORF Transcript_57711/g.180857 Transcript_57711/m.180857 type:complete len:388 (-) Transcript_57711:116-1279(-)
MPPSQSPQMRPGPPGPPSRAVDMFRSPTFFVSSDRQRATLEEFHKKDQHLSEAFQKNKALCFNASAYQRTHPQKVKEGHRDADATVNAPLILGVADGVSQVEDFGIDASLLPHELLQNCESLGMVQLLPNSKLAKYRGPIPLLQEAFKETKASGSTTVVMALLDNGTRIHGKLHPMIAVITIGDCELLILRRIEGRGSPLQVVFHTEMQRIDGHVQTPLQLARVDERIDPEFHEGITEEVIERGSAVHCVSAYEGDIVILGSDGVFDNLYLDEVQHIVNQVLVRGTTVPAPEGVLQQLARCLVEASHRKSIRLPTGQLPDAPIGRGGKMDDTSVVVGQVVEWTEEHARRYTPSAVEPRWGLHGLIPSCTSCCPMSEEETESCGEDDS